MSLEVSRTAPVAVCNVCRRLGRREPDDTSRTDGPAVFTLPADGRTLDPIGAELMKGHLAEHRQNGELDR